jgi:hypothetical protein
MSLPTHCREDIAPVLRLPAAVRGLGANVNAQLHRVGHVDVHYLITPGEFESRPKIINELTN